MSSHTDALGGRLRKCRARTRAMLGYYSSLPALWFAYGLQQLLWRPKNVGPFLIVDSASGPAADRLEAVEAAISLIKKHDNLAWKRLREGIPRILIVDRALPHYQPGLAACVLPKSQVCDGTTLDLALALVHEATHARIRRGRGRWIHQAGSAANRAEMACARRELRFAKLLPDETSHVTAIQHRIAQMRPDDFKYSDMVERRLRREGMPWYAIALRRIFEKLS